ncbi:Fc.00g074520.m01.CDS01 [Cosmosporella sp. VM-42]
MSRYGWSSSRDQVSPYTSLSGGIPAVTDEDFSYITSQDLDDVTDAHYYPRSQSAAPPVPEDDVLLIKNKGVTYPAHFPAYTIGDGKLFVKDVRERVGLMMELSERGTRRIKLLYKARQLKDPLAPVRDYGVKNNSELMAVIPDIDEGSSPSEEEMVIVDAPRDDSKTRRRKKRRSKKKGDKDDGSSLAASSPRDSTSTFDGPRSPSAPKSPPAAQSPLSGPGSAAMKQLADYSYEFASKWLPMCEDYIRAPPSDAKKRDDDHRKLTETIMQQILLKLDSIDSEGIVEVRTRRKALIQEVQDTFKRMDTARDA